MSLSTKQRVFIEEYLRCFNATAAARAAGYSEKSARSIGQENLTKPDIATEISRRLSERAMSVDEALSRLAEQGRGEHTRFIDHRGRVDLAGLKEAGLMHLVKGVKETPHGLVVEFYDAQAAIDKILRAQGAYVDRHEIGGKDGGPVEQVIRFEWVDDNNHDDTDATAA